MDGLEIEIEGDSEAAVALALLKIVMRAEGKDEGGANADWILATYKRCMSAVAGDYPILEDEDDEDAPDSDEDEGPDGEAAERPAA